MGQCETNARQSNQASPPPSPAPIYSHVLDPSAVLAEKTPRTNLLLAARSVESVVAFSGGSSASAQPRTPVSKQAWQRTAHACQLAAEGNADRMRVLLDEGVAVNLADYDKRTPLHIAATGGHQEVLKLLLARKADVSVKDRWGRTALDDAMRTGHIEVANLLLAVAGSTEVEQAAKVNCAASTGSVEVLQSLIAEGNSVNTADYDGRTALHVSAARGQVSAVKFLLSVSADTKLRDSFGRSPLDEAMRCGRDDVVVLLLEAGAFDDCSSPHGAAESQGILRQLSTSEQWAVPAKEVQLGNCISTTFKSSVYVAQWRGSKVVAKMVKDLDGELSRLSKKGSSKKVGTEDSSCKRALEELLHEIRTLSTLRHPDLVLFLGACFDITPVFFLTEYMEGGDLENYMRSQRQKTGAIYKPRLQISIQWAMAVARALTFLHGCSRPIIHRDLKPLNLLLNRNLDMKVTDFGLSKIMAPQVYRAQAMDSSPAPRMSGGVGTWRYMAPEVVRFEQYTDRIDIYAFALILYFIFTGQQPFHEFCGNDPELVLKAYLRMEEPRPKLSTSIATAELRQLMQDAWHVTAAMRPSAEKCAERLRAIHLAASEEKGEKGEACRQM